MLYLSISVADFVKNHSGLGISPLALTRGGNGDGSLNFSLTETAKAMVSDQFRVSWIVANTFEERISQVRAFVLK